MSASSQAAVCEASPTVQAAAQTRKLGTGRSGAFLLTVVGAGSLVGAWFGQWAGSKYGYICTSAPAWDPPVREFLEGCGWQLGAICGALVAVGFCSRLLQVVRQTGLRITPRALRLAGARLGTFFGLISALLLHGSLWVVAGFVAPRKPDLGASGLVLLGAGCGMVVGPILGWLCSSVGRHLLRLQNVNTDVAFAAPPALRMRLRSAVPISLAVTLLSASAGYFFGGLAAMGYRTVHYELSAMGVYYNRPELMSSGLARDLVEAASYRPFLHPTGVAVGLGSGSIVAALWMWGMMVRTGCRRRVCDACLAIAGGVAAGVMSTWILHRVLAETVLLDTARPGAAGSMFGSGLFFGVLAGAVVGTAGAVLLAAVTPRSTESETRNEPGSSDPIPLG